MPSIETKQRRYNFSNKLFQTGEWGGPRSTLFLLNCAMQLRISFLTH